MPLLGRHVARRAVDHRVGLSALTHEKREPEVSHPHPPVATHEHVGGLEVAVDEADVVGGGEGPSGVDKHGDLLPQRPVLGVEPLAQRDALDELHRDEQRPVVLADVVDRHHVGVVELGERTRLLPQGVRLLALERGDGPQQLDRELAVELRVERGVDDPHAAGTDAAPDLVATDLVSLFEVVEQQANRSNAAGDRGCCDGVGRGALVVGRRRHTQRYTKGPAATMTR